MELRPATKTDCRAIAELALMAGEGIPAYFWGQSRQAGQDIEDVGARNAASDTANFSYRNVHLAVIDNEIAGMILAYRLPDAENAENLEDFPEFIRPLIELEQCVPGSFYINMLATYPKYRNKAVGTRLMSLADGLAARAGCSLLSVEVFEQNAGALRLYQRLGYAIVAKRAVVPHPCHHYEGDIALLTKRVSVADHSR
jgi:ribosomal protein S18 acetylase RimI-like enzyme